MGRAAARNDQRGNPNDERIPKWTKGKAQKFEELSWRGCGPWADVAGISGAGLWNW